MPASLVLVGWLAVTIALPLWALLSKSFQNADGGFVGLANYIALLLDADAVRLDLQQLGVAILTTLIVIPLAFVYAYALTRSRMRLKGLFYAAAMLPLFAPSLLSAISLIYLFGNQGLLKESSVWRLHLRADRDRHRAGVLLLSARADHHRHRIAAVGCPAIRGRRCARDIAGRASSAP